jgi:acyl carrier protein phosphodiesterase
MNYLARLYLSEDFPESLLGSIMGDFDGPQASAPLAPGGHGCGYDT